MGLSIKNERTESLVRQLAKRDNVSMTAAITLAVNNELKQRSAFGDDEGARRRAAMAEFQAEFANHKWNPQLTEDEILGYDEFGVPALPRSQ